MSVKYAFRFLLVFISLSGLFSSLYAQNQSASSLLIEKKIVSGQPHESKRFYVKNHPELAILTTSGNIEIFENPSIEFIQVDLYVDRGFTLWSGSSSLENYRIIFQQNNDKITATIEPRRHGAKVWRSDQVNFHFVVQVPGSATTRVRSTKGDIYLRGVNGNHLIQTTAGNLFVQNSEGETNAFTASGN
ncbi:MAG: hypothetical protein ACFCU6_10000, partial [Balneolaceae bacterium]